MIREPKMSQKIIIFIVIFLLPLAFILGFYSSKTVNVRTVRDQVETELQYLLESQAMYANNDYSQEHMMHAKLLGMIDVMNDPYSDIIYRSGGTETSLRSRLSSNKKIGITFQFTPYNELAVISVSSDSGAFGKIFPGDIVVGAYVNEQLERFKNKSQEQITTWLQHKDRNDITLLLNRDDNELEVTVEYRALASTTFVNTELIEDKVGYIKLTQFEQGADSEFASGLKDLEEKNIEKLIIDLRDNPGGYVTVLDKIIQLLVRDENSNNSNIRKAVFRTKAYKDFEDIYTSMIYANPDLEDKAYLNNLVVLVNENSASAAEGLASVLQHHQNALVIGKPTYGKDLYQTTVQIGTSNYYFKYTEGHWLYKDSQSNDFKTLTEQPILTTETPITDLYLEDLNIRPNLYKIELTYQNQLISERMFLEYLYGSKITNDTDFNNALRRLATNHFLTFTDNIYDSKLSEILSTEYHNALINLKNDAYIKHALNHFSEK